MSAGLRETIEKAVLISEGVRASKPLTYTMEDKLRIRQEAIRGGFILPNVDVAGQGQFVQKPDECGDKRNEQGKTESLPTSNCMESAMSEPTTENTVTSNKSHKGAPPVHLDMEPLNQAISSLTSMLSQNRGNIHDSVEVIKARGENDLQSIAAAKTGTIEVLNKLEELGGKTVNMGVKMQVASTIVDTTKFAVKGGIVLGLFAGGCAIAKSFFFKGPPVP